MSITTILNLFKDHDNCTLSITDEGEFKLKQRSSLQCTSAGYKVEDDDRETLINFKKIIGEERLNQILKTSDYWRQYERGRLILDQKVCKFIFEKLQELPPPTLSYFDRCINKGHGLKGLREQIQIDLAARHFYKEHGSEEERKMYDAELLTSRFIDREPKVGSTITLSSGEFTTKAVFVKRGAYIALLQKGTKTLLVSRGTALSPKATGGLLSAINDILLDPGMIAIKTIWPDLKAYLETHSIKEIDLYGKSLGGAIVQSLAPLIQEHTHTTVTSLTTYLSIGVSTRVKRVFDKVFASKNIEINAIYNEGDVKKHEFDFIPSLGGVHVGYQREKAKVYSLSPSQSRVTDYKTISFFTKIFDFIRSFGAAHVRQTTLQPFRVQVIEAKDSYLSRGLDLETYRLVLAWIINIFTLGLLNRVSYESFFQSQLSSPINSPSPLHA